MPRTSFDFNLGAAPRREAEPRDAEAPMRIVVLGDFAGRGATAGAADDHAVRRPIAVNIDNFDSVLRKIGPRFDTADGVLAIGELDDFHPDALYRKLAVFERLRSLRDRLENSATFSSAAEELRAELRISAPDDAAQAPAPDAENDGATLSRLLGRTDGASAPAAAAPAGIDSFIRSIVAGDVVPDAPAHQTQYLAAADAALARSMDAVLHAPQFQALEAIWRGLYWLVSNLELGESLQLFVLDVSKAELLQDILRAGNDLTRSSTYRTLVEAPTVAGAEPWSLVLGAYEFGASGEDVALLASMGAIAAHAGAAFVASAAPALAGASSFAAADASSWQQTDGAAHEAWQALRHSAMAAHIGLAAPRMLLRLPYGKSTDPVSAFDYDEMSAARAHDRYLWGGGAFACALLIARAFMERGWDMEPGDVLDVDDLPAHSYAEDGETHLQACAETYLSERAGQALIERGLIPLLSYANRNAIRVMRFQSIAEPAQPLAGPW